MAFGDVLLPSFPLDGLLSQTWQDETRRQGGGRRLQASTVIPADQGPHTVLSLSFVP